MKGVLFPGQGSQYVGMGKDVYEADAAARELFLSAEKVLGIPFRKVLFEGPEDELVQTSRAQPAIFVHSLALWTAWGDRRPDFDFAAGHSLGEFSALTAAGAWDLSTGLELVRLRSAAMQKACDECPGTMAALLNLPDDKLEPLLDDARTAGRLQVANFNSPGQVAVSGEKAAVERAVKLAPAYGARRAMLLPVGGAFHSPLMTSAREELARALDAAPIAVPAVPIVLNATAEITRDPDTIRSRLKEQLIAPVLWRQSLEAMHREGVREFVEVGPGKVLQGLARRTLSDVATWGVDTADDLVRASAEETRIV